MSNEQKLREAVFIVLEGFTLDYNVRKILEAAYYRPKALATTEPEPTGLPELPEPVANVSASSPVGGIGFVKPDKSYFTEDQTRAYGEQCWKAGYKHGAWGTDTKDAERYQCIRRGQRVSVINGIGDILRAENLDAAIDAAMAQGVK